MKFCAAVLSTVAVALTFSGVCGDAKVAQANAAKEDGSFWDRYLQDVDSFTPPPVPEPTPPPVPEPTPPPVPEPTPPPVPEPTPPPVPEPTPPPVPEPTPPPTSFPTSSPTPGCDLTIDFNCTDSATGTSCEEIPSEEQLICSCPDCVRELVFTYTGAGCNGNEVLCTDFFPAPHPETARITICDVNDAMNCPFEETVSIGDTITLSNPNCLPDGMAATVSSESGLLLQTVQLVTGCKFLDQGLVLKEEYGSFLSQGYSCDESDVHNCLLEIVYGLESCNIGGRDEQVYDFYIDLDGEISDLTADIPESDLMLAPEECVDAVIEAFIDVCSDNAYCAIAVVNMTNPETGPPCETTDEIKFNFTAGTLPPTAVPETPPPVPSPTP
jgi:hypothetical protein